ncbi:MAG: hypothetical protein ABFD80_04370, partial [Acidobacteriota bacterium]
MISKIEGPGCPEKKWGGEGGRRKTVALVAVLGLAVIMSAISACVRYHPSPISSDRAVEDFEARRLDA